MAIVMHDQYYNHSYFGRVLQARKWKLILCHVYMESAMIKWNLQERIRRQSKSKINTGSTIYDLPVK
jgi:hypothetical protein